MRLRGGPALEGLNVVLLPPWVSPAAWMGEEADCPLKHPPMPVGSNSACLFRDWVVIRNGVGKGGPAHRDADPSAQCLCHDGLAVLPWAHSTQSGVGETDSVEATWETLGAEPGLHPSPRSALAKTQLNGLTYLQRGQGGQTVFNCEPGQRGQTLVLADLCLHGSVVPRCPGQRATLSHSVDLTSHGLVEVFWVSPASLLSP